MRRITTRRGKWAPAVMLVGLAFSACGGPDRTVAGRLPPGWRLIQKREYQALYGPDGRLQRLLHDQDGDSRADAIVFYGRSGRPERGEIDTDRDGLVDRWEELRPNGAVSLVAISRRRTGRPDLWERADPDGRVVLREADDDGDGRPDRPAPAP